MENQLENQTENSYHEISIVELMSLEKEYTSGANWFYWIAGLSVLTTILIYIGSSLIPAITLGSTEFLTYLAIEEPAGLPVFAFLYLAVIAVVLIIAYFSSQRIRWVYMVGIILFVLDTLLLVLVMDILGIVFHGIALYFLIKGYTALGKLKKLELRPA